MTFALAVFRAALTGIAAISSGGINADISSREAAPIGKLCTSFPRVIGVEYSVILRDFDIVALARVDRFDAGGVERPNEGTYQLEPVLFFKGMGKGFSVPGTRPPTRLQKWHQAITALHSRRAGRHFHPISSPVVKIGTQCMISAEMVLGSTYLVVLRGGNVLGYEPILEPSNDQMIADLRDAMTQNDGTE